jgi:hypothetical protein
VLSGLVRLELRSQEIGYNSSSSGSNDSSDGRVRMRMGRMKRACLEMKMVVNC